MSRAVPARRAGLRSSHAAQARGGESAPIPYHLFSSCSPFGADVLKHERSHGLRTARYKAAGAPPAATIRRPVGAKTAAKVNDRSRSGSPVPMPARIPTPAVRFVAVGHHPLLPQRTQTARSLPAGLSMAGAVV
jgi:hypothetical protein